MLRRLFGRTPAEPLVCVLHAAELAATRAEVRRLEKLASDRSFIADRLDLEVKRLREGNARLALELVAERAELADAVAPVTAPPANTACVCGGDAELHLRRQIVAAEQRALRDRANAVVLDNRLAAAEGRPVIGSLV